MSPSVEDLLGPDGVIAARLPGYERRDEQLVLAGAVERGLRRRRHLLAEAGTGVGKSFAYLLPAVLHACAHRGAGPVIVSTRTIALQQQLERVDLPFLHAVLPEEWTSVTAVGRNNYVCLRRLDLARRESGLLFGDGERRQQLDAVVQWSLDTCDGTRMDLRAPVDDLVWQEVQAEHGNCLHRACKHYGPCHYQRSRRRLDGAQIVVVNHALYMADVALRMAGASYLPAHEVVVFDEAHHVERTATEHLGLRVTASSVAWHLRRLHPRNAARSLLLQYGSPRAGNLWHETVAVSRAFFAELDAWLAARGGDALALEQRALDTELAALLGDLGDEILANATAIAEVDRRTEMRARADGLLGLQATLLHLCAPQDDNTVRWVERARSGAVLRSAPLEVSAALADHVFGGQRTAVLVSATLGTGDREGFGWLRERLGIAAADELQLGSPFDYRSCVRVVVEEALPDPARDAAGYLAESKSRVLDHLLRNGGRALVLCTSWAFVHQLADHVRPHLEREGIEVLVQGDAALQRLLERKKAEPTSVLIGTDSLWEGIDVPGAALTMVIVTRLPFARPDHPLARARMRAIEKRGGNAFADHSLPEALLKFRQGFGRLIRSGRDRGEVVILDPRVRTKAFGPRFLAALPDGAAETP